jgi:S-methylmethionine-dependent homocysteine/selenocysteine methylase
MVQSVALDHSAKYQGSQNPRVMISGNKTSSHEVDFWGFHGYCTVHEQEFMHQLFPSFPDGPQNMYCTLPNNKKKHVGGKLHQTTKLYGQIRSISLNPHI